MSKTLNSPQANGRAKKRAESTLEVISIFSKLPDDAQIRKPVVMGVTGISLSTLNRLASSGQLKAHRLTARTTTFNVGEVRAFLASKKAA